jgi:hypothetical protein
MDQLAFWLQLANIATKIAAALAEAKSLSPEEFAAKRKELDAQDTELVAATEAALRALLPQG